MEVKLVTHLCRICLSDNTLIPIFENTSTIKICDKIMACASVNVEIGDPLPTHICQQCHKALEVSYLFKTRCEQMDRQLRKIIEEQTVLLNQLNNPAKYTSVQISVEPPSESLFDVNSLKVEANSSETVHMSFPDENAVINENYLPQETAPLNSDPNLHQYPVSDVPGSDESSKEVHHVSLESTLFQQHESVPPESSPKHTNAQTDETEIMYFDNDDFHLGEECEVITDEIFHNNETLLDSGATNSPINQQPVAQQLPKGKYVIIKSIIKPQNIHYVNINNLPNKNSNEHERPEIENYIKQEHFEFSNIKTEVPEPAAYIETVTSDYIETPPDIIQDSQDLQDSRDAPHVPENHSPKCTTPEDNTIYTTPSRRDTKFKKRGRPKKLDKYKIPQGVSYLKSGRKNVPVFVRTRKTRRPRNSYGPKDSLREENTSANICRKTLPIVKRARVEKITPPRKFDDKKTQEPNRKLSTNLLLSDKHLNRLNDPQKQVLYQRLKLQSFRPTSKKDIFERGIPKPVHFVAPKLSEDDTSDEDTSANIGKRKINRADLSLKKIRLKNPQLETIDQDLKLINGSSYLNVPISPKPFTKNDDVEKSAEIVPAKTGRHTAIKSKRPQKRNHLSMDNGSGNTEKIEIELKMVPRKSERQRSPKKIFPEIDIFASPKRKVIEIPVGSENSKSGDDPLDYEIEKSAHAHNKFKIKIRGKRESSRTSDESIDLKYDEPNIINDDYCNEMEIDTERRNHKPELGSGEKESDTKLEAIKQILDKKRVQLDYGAGLTCNVCNKSFPYRSHLIRHVRTHTGLKPYSCEYCKKNFTSLSSLNIHVKNHIGDHPYSCEVCGRGFVQPSVLKRHMLSHTGEHPFQCDLCYKTFVHDSSLKTHLKMHTIKEPQHQCDICEKKFKYLSTLTSHLKTHSGIKPFTCPECRKAFYRRSLLTRHMRSHTKERPYKCKLCKARFAYSGGLASHKKLHTGIRPFECDICDFTFFRSSHLKNHMQKIHNNGVLITCQRCNMNFDSKPLYKRHLSLHMKKEQTVQSSANEEDNETDST